MAPCKTFKIVFTISNWAVYDISPLVLSAWSWRGWSLLLVPPPVVGILFAASVGGNLEHWNVLTPVRTSILSWTLLALTDMKNESVGCVTHGMIFGLLLYTYGKTKNEVMHFDLIWHLLALINLLQDNLLDVDGVIEVDVPSVLQDPHFRISNLFASQRWPEHLLRALRAAGLQFFWNLVKIVKIFFWQLHWYFGGPCQKPYLVLGSMLEISDRNQGKKSLIFFFWFQPERM